MNDPPAAVGRPDSWKTIDRCTHCGFCLPQCPTYQVENRETLSPRGRVSILLAVQSGELPATTAAAALSSCLVCRACHSACPAGVKPGKLILTARALAPMPPPPLVRLLHTITDHHGLTARLAQVVQGYRRLPTQFLLRKSRLLRLIPPLAHLESLLPPLPPSLPTPDFYPRPATRGRIGLLAGCIGRLIMPSVAAATGHLLTALGYEVIPLTGFGCCGAPHREHGDRPRFLRQARQTLAAFRAAGPLRAVVCDSSICAVTLSGYGRTVTGDPEQTATARQLAAQVRELAQFLAEDGTLADLRPQDPRLGRIVYHHHCQTVHGMNIMEQARAVLKLLPIGPSEGPLAGRCCGAAGDYQLTHPRLGRAVRQATLAAYAALEIQTVIGSNPGCLVHLAAGFRDNGLNIQVRHLAEALWLSVVHSCRRSA